MVRAPFISSEKPKFFGAELKPRHPVFVEASRSRPLMLSQACLLKAPSGNGGLLIFFETTQGITFLPARLNSNTEMEKLDFWMYSEGWLKIWSGSEVLVHVVGNYNPMPVLEDPSWNLTNGLSPQQIMRRTFTTGDLRAIPEPETPISINVSSADTDQGFGPGEQEQDVRSKFFGGVLTSKNSILVNGSSDYSVVLSQACLAVPPKVNERAVMIFEPNEGDPVHVTTLSASSEVENVKLNFEVMQEGWLKIEASDEVSVHIIGNYKKRRSMREQRRRRRSRTSYERSHLHDDACEALMSLREIDRRLIIDAGMTLYSDVKTRPVPSSEGYGLAFHLQPNPPSPSRTHAPTLNRIQTRQTNTNATTPSRRSSS